MTFYSRCQPAYLLLAVGIVVLVTGNPSETCPGMSQVEEDRFVCLACQARHFPAVYSSRRALRIHMAKSKNPQCAVDWVQIKVMTRPGDVIAGGVGGMGPCPPPQHQPPGGEYTCIILCIYTVYTIYRHGIFKTYPIYIPSLCIYKVYTIKFIP
jgi:hypothetical protein